MINFSSFRMKASLFFAFLFATTFANAAFDSAPITSAITEAIGVITVVGMALISLVVTLKLFTWVRQAIR